jgi:hypothetical protein
MLFCSLEVWNASLIGNHYNDANLAQSQQMVLTVPILRGKVKKGLSPHSTMGCGEVSVSKNWIIFLNLAA